MDQHLVSCFS